jgi:antirestriction protein ArdC
MELNDKYQKVTNMILSLLEHASNSDWQQSWVNLGGGIPLNYHSGNGYRGINFLLLAFIGMEKGYPTNRWLSVLQANELKARIKKGEKAAPVIFYKKTYFDKDGNKYTPEEVKQHKGKEFTYKSLMIIYNVFNVAQIEGLPEEAYSHKSQRALTEFERDQSAEDLLNLSGAKIIYEGNEALYIPARDEIILPTRKQFTGAEPFYNIAFHELAHWTGHPTRLNRLLTGKEDKKEYALEELVAELTTAFVCANLGFESQRRNNAAYLKSWINILKEDNKIIFTVCAAAQKAADLILQPLFAVNTMEA